MEVREASLAIRAAWLYYVHGLNQAEVADHLGISRVKVHRLIALAHQQSWVKVFVEGSTTEGLALEQSAKQLFNLQLCTVAPSDVDGLARDPKPDSAAWAPRQRSTCTSTWSTIRKAPIGVGHGRTLAAIADALPKISRPQSQFVSILGSRFRAVSNWSRRASFATPLNSCTAPAYDRSMNSKGLRLAREKMQAAGVDPVAVDVFAHYYRQIEHGETGIIAESTIDPLDMDSLADVEVSEDRASDAIGATAVIKLNGGLGTSMGMARAKSLLCVRRGLSFLDVIARQVLHLRREYGATLPLIFMNSFRTSADTLAALARYDDLAVDGLPLEFLQNKEPKLPSRTSPRWAGRATRRWSGVRPDTATSTPR